MDHKALREKFKCDISAIQAAPEAQRAAFEADFNKFLSHIPVGLQESAMGRALTGETVYLKIRADGPSVEIPACEVETIRNTYPHHAECCCGYCKDGMSFLPPSPQSEHFLGCLCERCIGIRAENPPHLVCGDGSVIPISEAEDEAFRRHAHREFAAADMEGSDADHPIATERKTVAGHVADILSDLQFGKCTRGEAVEVERAAKRAIADHDVARSIGKL